MVRSSSSLSSSGPCCILHHWDPSFSVSPWGPFCGLSHCHLKPSSESSIYSISTRSQRNKGRTEEGRLSFCSFLMMLFTLEVNEEACGLAGWTLCNSAICAFLLSIWFIFFKGSLVFSHCLCVFIYSLTKASPSCPPSVLRMTHVVLQRHREGQKENITTPFTYVAVQDSFVSCWVTCITLPCACVLIRVAVNSKKADSVLRY